MQTTTKNKLVERLSQNQQFPEIEGLVGAKENQAPTIYELAKPETAIKNPILAKLEENDQKLANLREAQMPFIQEANKYNGKIAQLEQERAQFEQELNEANKIIN